MSYNTTIPIYPALGTGAVGSGAPPPYSGQALTNLLNAPGIQFYDGPTGIQLSSPPKWGDIRLSGDKPYHGGIYMASKNYIAFHGFAM